MSNTTLRGLTLREIGGLIVAPAIQHGRRKKEEASTIEYRKEKVAVFKNADEVLEAYATTQLEKFAEEVKKALLEESHPIVMPIDDTLKRFKGEL